MNEWKNERRRRKVHIDWVNLLDCKKKLEGENRNQKEQLCDLIIHRFSWCFQWAHTRIHANFRSNVIYWMMMTKKKTKKKTSKFVFQCFASIFSLDRKHCCYCYYYTHTSNACICFGRWMSIWTKRNHICNEYFSMLAAQIWQHKPGICHLAIEMSQHFKSNEISQTINSLSPYVRTN